MLLVQRLLALGAPRRTAASSMTSSWYSVARWVSSQTTAARVTSGASGSPSWAASRASIGRNRLPPADIRWPAASRTNGCSLPTAAVSADSTRTRPVGERGAQRSLGEPGADGRRRGGAPVPDLRPRWSAVDCGTGSGHQPTKIAARWARSSTDPGTMPSARVAVAVIASTIVVGRPGTPTVGPSAAGGEKYMSTMTRR